MALIWADGFDHWGNAANMLLGSYSQASVTYVTTPANVRTGTGALNITGGDNADITLQLSVTPSGNKFGMGFAILATPAPTGSIAGNFHAFLNGSGGGPLMSYSFNARNGIDAFFGANKTGTLIGSTPDNLIVPGSYSYVEIATVLDFTNGTIIIRVNNAPAFAITGINTIGDGGDGTVHSAGFYKPGGTSSTWPSWYLDDLVYWDGSGSVNNDFFSDIRCRTIYPASNGANQAWVATGQAVAANCLNQVPAQPGVDYVTGVNVGDISTFNLNTIPVNTGAIHGVMVYSNLSKADAGTCTVTTGVASGGSTAVASTVNPGTGAAYYQKPLQTAPDGSNWTATNVNSSQAIIDRVA